ncbi:MAG: hypothetical protein VKI81_07060 [Synechococcaceae cyanobacterium]|nr:hypothetical protein [Synechococcaceae cyanobacterium]
MWCGIPEDHRLAIGTLLMEGCPSEIVHPNATFTALVGEKTIVQLLPHRVSFQQPHDREAVSLERKLAACPAVVP